MAGCMASRNAPLLALGAHVTPGTDFDPASSAILLAHPSRQPDPVTVADLAQARVPPVCVLFTCDGAGAANGSEWTGIATGLVWAGADWVVTTVSPTIEDRTAASLDQALLDAIGRPSGAPNAQNRRGGTDLIRSASAGRHGLIASPGCLGAIDARSVSAGAAGGATGDTF